MNERKFLNQQQPQTLVIATLLLYLNGAFNILNGLSFSTLLLLIGVAMGAGAFGIANEKKWGYKVAVAVTGLGVLELILVLGSDGIGLIISPTFWLYALFPVARFALLVHPMSREHQRIWFS